METEGEINIRMFEDYDSSYVHFILHESYYHLPFLRAKFMYLLPFLNLARIQYFFA